MLLGLSTLNVQLSTAFAQGTAFTYQGRLNTSGSAANGNYDFRFKLYTDPFGNNQVGATQLTNAIPVTAGLFTTTIDFGAGIFSGGNYWLEVDVRSNGADSYTVLSPFQAVTPTPYAVMANTASNLLGALPVAQLGGGTANISISGNATTATTANNFSGSLSGDVTGTQGATVVANVGGQSAANVAGGASAANAATSASTANTIVKCDALGNFSASTVTANLSGNATSATTAGSLAIPPGMVLIPAGAFTMGNSIHDSDITDAAPTNVTVSAFYMDVNLVSYSQWQSVYYWATNHGYGFDNAGSGKAVNHPVQTVDWYDCVKWCNARSQQAGLTPVYYTITYPAHVYTSGSLTPHVNWAANGYRLPTEAEWEKAARGGLSGQRFPWGNVITENLANYSGNTSYSYDLGPNGYNSIGSIGGTSPATSPVGSFAPNGYGLYDMAGNVFERCWDWYGTPYGQPTPTNPTGPGTGSFRVMRGGSWRDAAYQARCADRNYSDLGSADDGIGFRCVRGL